MEHSYLNLVGEGTRCETSSNGSSTSVCGKLQHSSLAMGAAGDDKDLSWVLDGSNSTGS